jgi:hypothetical protein
MGWLADLFGGPAGHDEPEEGEEQKEECNACDGECDVDCPDCEGSGFNPDGTYCNTCDGTGCIECDVCDGAGGV